MEAALGACARRLSKLYTCCKSWGCRRRCFLIFTGPPARPARYGTARCLREKGSICSRMPVTHGKTIKVTRDSKEIGLASPPLHCGVAKAPRRARFESLLPGLSA